MGQIWLCYHFLMIDPALLNLIKAQFQLDLNSDHGLSHWSRVAEIGRYLSEHTRADVVVVNLFAYLHDARRQDEWSDPAHGERAGIFAQELYENKFLGISPTQIDQLCYACKHHNRLMAKSEDITVQTCWDADRLDLWRVGITPKEEFLYTAVAKQDDVIALWQR